MFFDTYQNLFSNFSFGSLFISMICYWISLNFSNLKVSNKIFNFSYNINQLIKAREIKENVA